MPAAQAERHGVQTPVPAGIHHQNFVIQEMFSAPESRDDPHPEQAARRISGRLSEARGIGGQKAIDQHMARQQKRQIRPSGQIMERQPGR